MQTGPAPPPLRECGGHLHACGGCFLAFLARSGSGAHGRSVRALCSGPHSHLTFRINTQILNIRGRPCIRRMQLKLSQMVLTFECAKNHLGRWLAILRFPVPTLGKFSGRRSERTSRVCIFKIPQAILMLGGLGPS